MIVNAAVQEIFSLRPGDEIVTCSSEEYFNSGNPKFSEVIDIVKDPGKLIILTR